MTETVFECLRDGLTVRGRIYGEQRGKRPAIILSHALLSDQTAVRAYARRLAGIGLIAATFDFCGGGPRVISDGAQEDMTIETELADLEAVFAHVKAMPCVDGTRISLFGGSQGGLVAAIAAKRHENEIDRLILECPALSIPDKVRSGNLFFCDFDPLHLPELLCETPMRIGRAYAEYVLDMDVYSKVGFTGKTLWIHGTEDELVDIAYARRAQVLFPNCVCHEMKGAHHSFTEEEDRQIQNWIVEFMEDEGC